MASAIWREKLMIAPDMDLVDGKWVELETSHYVYVVSADGSDGIEYSVSATSSLTEFEEIIEATWKGAEMVLISQMQDLGVWDDASA